MRRALLVSLALHTAVMGGAAWWLGTAPDKEPALAIRIDLGTSEVPARKTSAAHAALRAPVPELPPAYEVPEPAPDAPGENYGNSGDKGGPVVDALTPGQSLEKPALLGYPPPEYPRDARRRGWQGVVEALVTVDASGKPLDIAVSHSSGHPEFDSAAVSALKGARYKPGTVDGAPATATLTVTVRFRLE